MDIESKLDEDRIEIIRKAPDVGDMVAYNRQWDGKQYTKELGIVTETYESTEEDKTALVYWFNTQDEEEFYTKCLLNVRLKQEN
tara:strand:- start:462 stop:713 length:252 start_codon:yes stop_codon:yes gene_type:complete